MRNRDWLVNTKRASEAPILRCLGPAPADMAGDPPAFPLGLPGTDLGMAYSGKRQLLTAVFKNLVICRCTNDLALYRHEQAFPPPLLVIIAKATSTELQRYIDYLKAENQILRSKLPRRVDVTPAEREKLVKVGKPLGGKLKELMSIVSPRTFTRWANGETKSVGKKAEENKGGRPRKPDEIRELVIRFAKENSWGLGRILGELKKLGLQKISKGTVRNILLENGFELGPKRGPGTWDEFIKIHVKTLWACDFFSKKVATLGGMVEYFVLFFIQPGTRKVHIAGITHSPDGAWMAQQARNLCMFLAEQPEPAKYIVCDRDTKCSAINHQVTFGSRGRPRLAG